MVCQSCFIVIGISIAAPTVILKLRIFHSVLLVSEWNSEKFKGQVRSPTDP